jgi:Family of unknown function (DUF6134)
MRRRALLAAAMAETTLSLLPCPARGAAAVEPSSDLVDRRFAVLHDGVRIGAHTIAYSRATGDTRVTTTIDLVVKALFFTVFAFSHRSEEIWRDGRLMRLSSETLEHGERLRVSGAATPHGFRVVGKSGPFLAASDALTSNSLWTPAVLEQDTVIDAQHGGVFGVSVRKLGDEQISLGGTPVRTARYQFITPYLAGSIWYDASGRWVRGEFERDGAEIQYRLET